MPDGPLSEDHIANLGIGENLLELTQASTNLAVLGFYICIIGLFSHAFKNRLFVSDATIATLVGIVLGPIGANWITIWGWANHDEEMVRYIVYTLTRIILGIQVLFTGIALPKLYLRHHWRSLAMLILPVMTAAWLCSAFIMWLVFPNITYLECLVMSACITPTDPVLAASVIKGKFAEKHVPPYVRDLIAAESGANDGMGFPFIYLALFLMQRHEASHSLGWAIGNWVVITCIYDVVLGCVIGAIIGFVGAETLKFAKTHNLVDHESFLAYGIGMVFFTLGVCGLIGTDDILACFIAGNAFTWDDYYRVETQNHSFQDVIDILLDSGIFILIGSLIPWGDFTNAEYGLKPWHFAVTALAIIIFRRLPWVLLTYKAIPELRHWKEALFTGWFGPMGVGALYYLETAYQQAPESRGRMLVTIGPLVYMVILFSVFVHGFTLPIFQLHVKAIRAQGGTATMNVTHSRNLESAETSSTTVGDGPEPEADNDKIQSGDKSKKERKNAASEAERGQYADETHPNAHFEEERAGL